MAPLPTVLSEFPALGARRADEFAVMYRGFSGAHVCAIVTVTGQYAVRRWPAGWSAARLVGLHRLLAVLSEQGLDFISIPIRSRAGGTLVTVDGSLWQVEPWLPGLPESTFGEGRLASTMRALAQWHLAAARFDPAPEHAAWFSRHAARASPAVIERRERLQALNATTIRQWAIAAEVGAPPELRDCLRRMADLVLRDAARIQWELESAMRCSVPVQPVLRDVWRDHILFTGDEVTGIVDPSACRSESVAADLARLLGSMLGDDAARWNLALAAYEQLRPLSPDERALIPILDRSGVLLSAATWLEWLGPARRVSPDDARVLPRVRELTARLERESFDIRRTPEVCG
jgi:Ser/Thr protein kinase RdoA (MazF antagonist)